MKNIQKNHQTKTNTRKKITQDWQEEKEKIQYLEKDKKLNNDTKDQYYINTLKKIKR